MEAQIHETMPSSTPTKIDTPHMALWQKVFLFSLLEIGIIAGSIMGGIAYGKQLAQELPLPGRVASSSLPPILSGTIPPVPTISPTFVCSTLAASLFPTPKEDEGQICQVVELRTRDLLQATYNLHHLLREIQSGQIQQNGPHNKVNNLSNDLIELWLNIAGYGLGADPYANIQIQVGSTGFKEAKVSPTYGFTGYQSIGMPRLYNRFIENSSLSAQAIQQRETNFSLLLQPYSNPAQYPFRNFFDRAYKDYRNGLSLTSKQYVDDLTSIDEWLTKLEKVLLQIPSFLGS